MPIIPAIQEFILVTMVCTTMHEPCETYQTLPMTSEDCEVASQNVLRTAQMLELKETVLTYCTNIHYEEE